jgi:energy-coupling factor transport system ATP-binding protein
VTILVNELEHIYSKGTAYEKKALHDVNFKIENGEMIGLIGHTGSGKSTLIQHLNGLLKPTAGGIYYDGMDIFDKDFSLKKLRSKVGLVFQYPEHQLFENTVLEDVKFGPKNIGMEPLEVDMSAFLALRQVGIGDDILDVSPMELSGGQKRRVAIAGVLAMQPEVLILDEPTAGLDPAGRDEILDLVKQLHDEREITVIIVSHSMEDMARYVERLIVMDAGTVAYDGTTEEVFSHYKELEKLGLRAPQVMYVMEKLAARGISLPQAITVEQALESIMGAEVDDVT